MKYYSHQHLVGFEETNLVGNVYYVNHLRWQGKCREMFLRDNAPGILEALHNRLALVTLRCQCEYFAEVFAFDRIEVRMFLSESTQNKITMDFDYWRLGPPDELIAKGSQQIACMERRGSETLPIPVPTELQKALKAYR